MTEPFIDRAIPGLPENPEDVKALADHVAGRVSSFMEQYAAGIGITEPAVIALTRRAGWFAVLRAFGCTCRDHSDAGAVYAEELWCTMHHRAPLPPE